MSFGSIRVSTISSGSAASGKPLSNGFDGSISYQAWNLYGADNADSFRINSIFEAIYLAIFLIPLSQYLQLQYKIMLKE